MKIKQQVQALRDLIDDTRLESRIDSLRNYSAAQVLWKSLDDEMEESDYPKKTYMMEKLALFISYFNYAVMPISGSDKTTEQWLEVAKSNLFKVENDVIE